MIGLANADLAVIEEAKVTLYLLSSHHPVGRAKAAFFRRYGFTLASWAELREALLDHARSARIVSAADTRFGRKYSLEGSLWTPDGRAPRVR
jgi:Domain of unknown function (DUF6883)